MPNNTLHIGDTFTPIEWAKFAIKKFDIFEKWLSGCSIFDPTMGEGNLLEALISYGLENGYTLDTLPTNKLFGNELNAAYYQRALIKFKSEFGLDMSAQFSNEDIMQLKPQPYDIIFGNPPWQNFVDLPTSYKEQIKKFFVKYNHIENRKNLLLGNSRIDIASLVIQIALNDFLKKNGDAIFFIPLSILLNDGANKHFRNYKTIDTTYQLTTVFDFNEKIVFKNVATRYGLAHFKSNHQQHFPIPYYRIENKVWKKYIARPIFDKTDPLSIIPSKDKNYLEKIQPIILPKSARPRQGINTCGANDIYFFDTITNLNNEQVMLSNKKKSDILLPRKFIFPLITSNQFRNLPANKWVLLPYNNEGKPMSWEDISLYPELKLYLENNEERLKNRKGILVQTSIKRGFWWVMLGVGSYNFAKFKIVWEAYGAKTFNPKLFEGNWQANQSLQAFIPADDVTTANKILVALKNNQIEQYLHSLKMEGTMNWAQPGKIQKFIQFSDCVL